MTSKGNADVNVNVNLNVNLRICYDSDYKCDIRMYRPNVMMKLYVALLPLAGRGIK